MTLTDQHDFRDALEEVRDARRHLTPTDPSYLLIYKAEKKLEKVLKAIELENVTFREKFDQALYREVLKAKGL